MFLFKDYAINFWISGGFPREKVVVGLPAYGRSFTLTSASDNGLGAAARGAGSRGIYTGEAGMSSVSIYKLINCRAGFTLHDTLPSLLGRTRICQCKRGGARARLRVFLSCARFSASSTARAVCDYRLSQPIGLLLFQRIFTDANFFIS